MKHPKTIEEISAPWMTDVLRGAGILRRATVLAVDVHAIGQGVGFLSGRARVTLTYDQAEEGAPPPCKPSRRCTRSGVRVRPVRVFPDPDLKSLSKLFGHGAAHADPGACFLVGTRTASFAILSRNSSGVKSSRSGARRTSRGNRLPRRRAGDGR